MPAGSSCVRSWSSPARAPPPRRARRPGRRARARSAGASSTGPTSAAATRRCRRRRRRRPRRGSAPAKASRARARMRASSSSLRRVAGAGRVQRARADGEGARPGHAVGQRADRDLGRAAAHVDDGDRARRRLVERAGRAEEGEPRLLVPGQHVGLQAGALAQRADSASRLAAARIAAVATTRTARSRRRAPAARCSATTSATSSIFASRDRARPREARGRCA